MPQKSSIKKLALIVVGIVLLIAVNCSYIFAASPNSLYADHDGYSKGDIVTVIVTESSTANQQATTDVSQSNQANVGAGTGILDFINPFGVNQSDNSTASGSTSRSGNLSAELAVEVVEVLDNGNLRIEGNKVITVNGEDQEIKLQGIVRPADITENNTVESTYVANLDIKYKGKGAVGNKQKPGIISRILNWLF